jgi:hypothetical protein
MYTAEERLAKGLPKPDKSTSELKAEGGNTRILHNRVCFYNIVRAALLC